MKNIFSVGQVNSYVRNLFVNDFVLQRIQVRGEVSNCKYHSSGHIYFSLKDQTGVLACVMFAGQRRGLAFRMQDGQQVVVSGNISVYERDGRYQLYAARITLDGAGLLYEKFEALKRELEEMGMFAPEYKKPIPPYVKKVGIVTASTGAAIRDIVNISHRRNPYVQLVLYPAIVQGSGAVESIVKGICVLDQTDVDVIIIGRGGGSIEDLWAFNEEDVARAVFACNHPVISAVGHETDVTITDYVADLRAPTPSVAAELAVYELTEFESRLLEQKQFFRQSLQQKLQLNRHQLLNQEYRFRALNPGFQLQNQKQRADELQNKITAAMQGHLKSNRHRMEILAEKFHGLSPLLKLSQGYSFSMDETGRPVSSVTDVRKDQNLSIAVRDGYIDAKVTGIREEKSWTNKVRIEP